LNEFADEVGELVLRNTGRTHQISEADLRTIASTFFRSRVCADTDPTVMSRFINSLPVSNTIKQFLSGKVNSLRRMQSQQGNADDEQNDAVGQAPQPGPSAAEPAPAPAVAPGHPLPTEEAAPDARESSIVSSAQYRMGRPRKRQAPVRSHEDVEASRSVPVKKARGVKTTRRTATHTKTGGRRQGIPAFIGRR
jgi:hypothetical protein